MHGIWIKDAGQPGEQLVPLEPVYPEPAPDGEFGAYLSIAYGAARRLTGEDRDDTVQESMVKLVRRGGVPTSDDPDAERNVDAYIGTVVRNKHIDRVRTKTKKTGKNDSIEGPMMPFSGFDAFSDEDSTDVMFDLGGVDPDLTTALGQLTYDHRQVLALHVDGLSNVEIAEKLGIPVRTVGTRLIRARRSAEKHLASVVASNDEPNPTFVNLLDA